jgi:predicted porin
MNKKLGAIAVAGALAAPAVAFAQASNVEIYGRANVGLDSWSATGATAGSNADFKSRTRVFDGASRIGFRGTEDLGGGLKTLFQLESGINLDSGSVNGQSGAPNVSSGTLASRDSYVGIGGSWGDVRFGRQSVFWISGVIAQTGANFINAEVPFANATSMGRVSTAIPGGAPVARQSNVISYNSPILSGWNGTLSYSPQSEAAAASVNTDSSLWGATVRYNGALNFQWDYVVNQQGSGGAQRQKSTGNKLGLSWPYAPGSRISLTWAKDKMDDTPAVASFTALHDNVSATMLAVNWEHMVGNWQYFAQWGKVQKASGCTALNGAANGCDGTDAVGYMLAVKYHFSRRTGVYLSYNQVRNGANQINEWAAAGYSSAGAAGLPASAAGADPRVVAVGVLHNF